MQKEKNDDDEGAEGRQKSKGREERNEDKNQIFLKTKTIAIAKSYSMPNTVAFCISCCNNQHPAVGVTEESSRLPEKLSNLPEVTQLNKSLDLNLSSSCFQDQPLAYQSQTHPTIIP